MDNQRMMLETQIALLTAQSKDANFTAYLNDLLGKVRNCQVTTDYAVAEVNRTYRIYLENQNMQATPAPVQPKPVSRPVQQQSIAQPVQQVWAPQPVVRPPYVQKPLQGQQAPVRPIPQQVPVQPVPQQVPVQPAKPAPQQVPVPPVRAVPQPVPKKNMEFAIGAGLFSVIGVLFVLIAFVMLGLTYMSGLIKGLCLYAIALAVLLVSELILTKKMPKFAVGITGLGICGLYLSTMLNYLYLENFNGIVALLISIAISLTSVFISRKKDSGTIKIISFIGCYICIFPVGDPLLGIEIWDDTAIVPLSITIAILFLVNLMTLLLPVKKNQDVVSIVHMIANALFSIVLGIAILAQLEDVSEVSYILFFLLISVLTQGLIWFFAGKNKKDRGLSQTYDTCCSGTTITYIITNVFLSIALLGTGCFVLFDNQYMVHLATAVYLLICILLYVLVRKTNSKWIPYWFGSFFALSLYWFGSFSVLLLDWYPEIAYAWRWWRLGVTLSVFFVAKLLTKKKELRVSELIITLLTAWLAIWTFAHLDLNWYGQVVEQGALIQCFVSSVCFLSAFLVSVLALYRWKSLYEEIILGVFMAFVFLCIQNEFMPALLMSILFMGVVGFNSFEFTRDKHIYIYNYINLGFAGILYLTILPIENHLLYAVMLVLGILFILLTFRKRYGMDFKIKNLILVLFLCYMILIWRMPLPIIKSIILAVIAIGSVASGFALRQKALRITGLSLTMVVCVKIVLYDFAELVNLEKMILFLIVGLIVLAISGIYIALEKKIV